MDESGPIRILLVEDNRDFANLVEIFLRKHEKGQFEIVWKENGDEALHALLGGERFDVILMDYFLPGQNGLEVTRALQFFFTSTSYNQVDQIVLAGGCSLLPGLDELVGKRAGVSAIVGNPFANMAVSDRIRPRQLATDAPLLLIACGLAMRSFD